MFAKLLGKSSVEAEKKTAQGLYETIKGFEKLDRAKRTMAARAALLARNHLDLTFVDACQRTEAYEAKVTLAMSSGGDRPDEPRADEFQKIKSSGRELWVYLPEEYVIPVFLAGVRYQRMELGASDAIAAVQRTLDRLTHEVFRLEHELTALSFLRDELAEGGLSGSDWSNEGQ